MLGESLGKNIPSSSSQQRIDHRGVQGGVLQLLQEGGLVKGHTGRKGLGDDSLAFLHQLGCQSMFWGG